MFELPRELNCFTPSELCSLQEIIMKLHSQKSEHEYIKIVNEVLAQLPVEKFIAWSVSLVANPTPRDLQHFINLSYPKEWVEACRRSKYWAIDPVIKQHFAGFGLQIWSQTYKRQRLSPAQQMFIRHSREYDMHDGLTIGLPCYSQDVCTAFSFAGAKLVKDHYSMALINYLMPHLHIGMLNLDRKVATLAQPLTHREMEILKWVANGKTNDEIAMILRISEATVKFHLANAMRKLGAVTRAHAVGLAMKFKCIDW